MIRFWKERRGLRARLAEAEAELKLAAKLIETLHAEIANGKRAQIAVAQLLEIERERNKDLFQQGVDQAFRIHDLERELREGARV